MVERTRDYYLRLRRPYQPEHLTLVIVAESPPASGKYFYDCTGSPKEPLFSALMQQLGISPSTKEIGLREFQRKGWVLVDATYEPVDKLAKEAELNRDAVIARDLPLLLADLAHLTPDRSVPVVLVKANVCRALEPLLLLEGFNVVNRRRPIYFPSNGQQMNFKRQFGEIVNDQRLLSNPISTQVCKPDRVQHPGRWGDGSIGMASAAG